ncbi:hypothetical protein BDD43_3394 [Mucilaginibacter gracilis]|uniref:Uncharacterized protein n=1 Tax=Mucilaginibacter gracilis TaxID=423350 RepID=A0A495J3L1_9SPHI|nr:hypothetical protein [Mucilaginibacter gracilis]RKR83192.1 hypothetical protein BDD43_3394 [Mucilaginibacter gracilis]
MSTIRKDGKAYDGGDVNVDILGAIAYEVEDISYNTKQDHQLNYALGSNEPVTWSRGKKAYECSLTIAMTEGIQFESIAPNGDLMAIPPFPINVSFVNEFNAIVNDTITCKFQNQGREISGEMGLKFKYDMFVLGISYNNA